MRPPKDPPPDHFDLAYFVHCLAYLEQEERLWLQRAQRIVRVSALSIQCVLVLLLAGCQWHWVEVPTPPLTVEPRMAPPTVDLMPTITPTPVEEAQ